MEIHRSGVSSLFLLLLLVCLVPSDCYGDGCVSIRCREGMRCVFTNSLEAECVEATETEKRHTGGISAEASASRNAFFDEALDEEEIDEDILNDDKHIRKAQRRKTTELQASSFSECEQRRQKDLQSCAGLVGCTIVQCSADGQFSPMQCGPTGYCWCVDKDGKTKDDTHTPPAAAQPNCETHQEESTAPKNKNSAQENSLSEERRSNEVEGSDQSRSQPVESNQPTSESQVYSGVAKEDSTHPSMILLWIVVACGAVMAVALPAIFVCAFLHYRRYSKSREKAQTTIYPGQGCTPPKPEMAVSEQDVILQSYHNHRQHQENAASRSQSSVVRHPTPSQEPVHGHMDIYTGHRVLSYLDNHIEHPDRLDKEWEALLAYEVEDEKKTEAEDELNYAKNRYPDILPYNRNRVHLESAINPSRRDYINASYICDRGPQPIYIATQGPLELTVSDFWQMVWEQGCSVLVNLTELVDHGIPQSHQYWPSNGKATYHMYEIDFVSSHPVSSHYTIRSFFLKNLKTEATRTVTQCHFHSWPSLSVPDDPQPLLEFRRKVKKTYSDASKPIIVHDSAGVGRTGTYMLIDMALNRLSSASVKEIDIAASVEHLRDQRMSMVKTEAQFKFAFRALVNEVRAILDAMPGNSKP